jgi:hypothetical protein
MATRTKPLLSVNGGTCILTRGGVNFKVMRNIMSPVHPAEVQVCVMFQIKSANVRCGFTNKSRAPDLPLGIMMDKTEIDTYYAILVDEGGGLFARRALAHRIFQFDRTDVWWLVEPNYRHTDHQCQMVRREIHSRWKRQSFPLQTGIFQFQPSMAQIHSIWLWCRATLRLCDLFNAFSLFQFCCPWALWFVTQCIRSRFFRTMNVYEQL